MATARIETKEVEVTKTETRRVVVLELSEREAMTLSIVASAIAGNPDGPRKDMDSIRSSLWKVGFTKDYMGEWGQIISCTMTMTDGYPAGYQS